MSDKLLETTVGQFLDRLASSAPTPGGGSVAALTGAMAAGLITMVCDLTIGKKQYADFEAEAKAIRERAEAYRAELQQLAQLMSMCSISSRQSTNFRAPPKRMQRAAGLRSRR
jgi:Formimidoyltetrahydrofolate cyclodeaminase (EC 4.3.1.4)